MFGFIAMGLAAGLNFAIGNLLVGFCFASGAVTCLINSHFEEKED